MVIDLLTDLKNDILERLEARLAAGESLDDAVAAVHGAIMSEGQSERFVRECGAEVIRNLWRYANRGNRTMILTNNGSRRHDPSLLNTEGALFKLPYKVGGEWIPLGDFTRDMCEDAAGFFKGQAAGNMREAYMFGRLAAKLRGAQTVRTRFTEDGIRAILKGFKLE